MDNLTRDSLAAQAAGMTYGKYMVRKGVIQPIADTQSDYDPSRVKNCPVCDAAVPVGGKRIYCSKSCKNRAYYLRKVYGGESG